MHSVEDAVKYFKSMPGYDRFFFEMIRQYRRFGAIKGTIALPNPTKLERDAMQSLFRTEIREEEFHIACLKFQDALNKTKFRGVDAKILLDTYAGEKLVSNKEMREGKQKAEKAFFLKLSEQFCDANSKYLFSHMPNSVLRFYRKNGIAAWDELSTLLASIALLPLDKYERLSVFAERMTGNPHRFDPDQLGVLLNDSLKVLLGIKETLSREDETELYATFGLMREDVLNFVSISGLVSDKAYWQQAYLENAVQNIPLRELIKTAYVKPAVGKVVFAVENSGVFSAILDRFQEKIPPLICLHGQPKMSSLLLLDRLVQGGNQIFYAGDFDPEGLLICDRLHRRFGEKLVPWRMGREDFDICKGSVPISSRRLKMLRHVSVPELKEVRVSMLGIKTAGYQEALVPLLCKDMQMKMGRD